MPIIVKGRPFKGRLIITNPVADRHVVAEPSVETPSSDGPSYLGVRGARALHPKDRLVDLGYEVGETIRLLRVRPTVQDLVAIIVESDTMVEEIVKRFTRNSYGVRLDADASGRGPLFVYVLEEAGFETEFQNGLHLMER